MTIRIVHPIFLTKKNQEKFLPRPKIHGQKFGLKISTVKKSPKKFSQKNHPTKKLDQISRSKKMTSPKIFPKNPKPNFP